MESNDAFFTNPLVTDDIDDIINPALVSHPTAPSTNTDIVEDIINNIPADYQLAPTPQFRPMTPVNVANEQAPPPLSESVLPHISAYRKTKTKPDTKKIQSSKTRPAFVNKLWTMVNDPKLQHLIHWNSEGTCFIVSNRESFVSEILPKYFKHSNFASFVRQLNMYGWHKVQDVKSGTITGAQDEKWAFQNENFQRGKPDLLDNIMRQKAASNDSDVDIGMVMNELETIRMNQMAIAEDLKRVRKDNQSLWKENYLARERHQSQQQALEKILQFLATLYGSNAPKLIDNVAAAVHDEPPRQPQPQQFHPRLLLKGTRDSPIQELDRHSLGTHSLGPTPDNSVFLNSLNDHINKQDESLQEVQDWISKIVPDYDGQPTGSTGMDAPDLDGFNVDSYLNQPTGLTPMVELEDPLHADPLKRLNEEDEELLHPTKKRKM